MKKPKLKVVWAILAVLLLCADVASAQSKRLTFSMNNTTIADVMDRIEAESDYTFLVLDKSIAKTGIAAIEARGETIDQVMGKLLAGTGIGYRILDKQIILSPPQHQAKGRAVAGIVRNQSGEPLVGATIIQRGSRANAAISDAEGHFLLPIDGAATLDVSHYGHIAQAVAVTAGQNIEIVMQEDPQNIEDVVVVGYGVQKRGSVTGSVVDISSSDIVKAPSSNLSNSLAGKLPGLRVVTRSGEPGNKDSDIDVRGFGKALVIVDGVPGSMNDIDPNEIENISVLKDAAASVYGVMAANGVVLITTKRGLTGEPRVNASATFTWQRPTIYPKMLNAAQFVELYDESAVNQGKAPIYGKDILQEYRSGAKPSYDWYKATVRDWAPQQQYNVNIRGGKDEVKYFASAGYLNEGGMWRSGDHKFDRFNFRSNLDAKLIGGLSARVSVSGSKETRDAPDWGVLYIIAGIQKNFPIYNPYANGNKNYYARTSDAFNPLAYTDKNCVGNKLLTKYRIDGSATLNYDASAWAKGLSAKAMYYYRYANDVIKNFQKKFDLYTYDKDKDLYVPHESRPTSSLYQENAKNDYNNFQGSINYSRKFGKHDVAALAVFETRLEKLNWMSAYRKFEIDLIDELNSGKSEGKDNKGSSDVLANIGYIGRFNYAYDDRYLVEFQFRYDGSSRFPKDGRWGFFPSVSAGWRISEEGFIKNKARFIENLKLRASWGRLGDDQTNPDKNNKWNPYLYNPGYTFPSGSYIMGDGAVTSGLVDKGLTNPNLTWFTSDIYNIGLDFSFWKGMLSGEIDVFYRRRQGLLGTLVNSLPGTFGAKLPQQNLNSDSYRGFEISLAHRNILDNGFTYMIRGNVSYTRSRNEFIERASSIDQYRNWRDNGSYRWENRIWGYTAIGQFQSWEDIATSPVQDSNGNRTLSPGDVKYLDYNGDGVIDENDQHIIGRSNKPEYTFGLDFSAAWKGFDLTVFLQGAANFNILYGGQFISPFFNGESSINAFMDRWRHEDPYDPNSKWIPGKYPSTYAGGKPNNTKSSTFWMQNCSYLRLKELQLGYTIPARLTRKAKIESLRVSLTAYNIFTVTGAKLLDPESVSSNGRFYPQQKSISFGVNLTF